jgi:predicted lipoprotein with Yx(FWY)xxD motif
VRRLVPLIVLVALAATALGVGGPGAAPDRRQAPLLKLRQTAFGEILVNGQGRTLYRFSEDGRRLSRCGGGCARTWPPFITPGRPRLGAGVMEGLVGTIRRPNGKLQVTYRGRPVYFYAHEGPRQVLCHNVTEFGGLWKVVDRLGNAVP